MRGTNFFFYQQKYDYIIYNVNYITIGTIVYTTLHHTMQSYGDLIHAVQQELGNHRLDYLISLELLRLEVFVFF